MINSIRKMLEQSIKKNEGFVEKAYIDSLGIPTFGYGFTYLSKEEADYIFTHRLQECIDDIEKYVKEQKISIDEVRISILAEMRYQLGMNGLLAFKKMWKAIREIDYETASNEMKNSRWFKQTPVRAGLLAKRMLTGVY